MKQANKIRKEMIIHTKIKYSIILVIPLILLILLSTVSAANDNRVSNENSKSIEALKQAIRINPNDAEAHISLGLAYLKSGMNKEAIDACKQAIRINPDSADAHYNLGLTYAFLNDRASTRKQCEILKNLDPELAYKLFNLINVKIIHG